MTRMDRFAVDVAEQTMTADPGNQDERTAVAHPVASYLLVSRSVTAGDDRLDAALPASYAAPVLIFCTETSAR